MVCACSSALSIHSLVLWCYFVLKIHSFAEDLSIHNIKMGSMVRTLHGGTSPL